MAWRKMQIKEFLTPRKERYKADDPAISDMPRIEKIDFTGKIFISNKPSKTGMIVIQPGDFVISGINVAKGAMAVYQGDIPVKATIHYSSYGVDHNIINLEYFKRFLKSPVFIRLLKEQVPGGIKTEIKPKHLLPLTIDLPDTAEQESILSRFQNTENEHAELRWEIDKQKNLLSKLRQAILQEAIQGKLTTDWREQHPDVEPASELLKRIAAEKAELVKAKKIRKHPPAGRAGKPLPPITDDDLPAGKAGIPFETPETWEWCRLGDIIYENPRNGYSGKPVNKVTKTATLKLGATTSGRFLESEIKYLGETVPKESHLWLTPGDILIQRSNSLEHVGVSAIFTGCSHPVIYPDLMMKIRVSDLLSNEYIHIALSAPVTREYFRNNAKGAQKSMPKINQGVVCNTLVSVPSRKEQKMIVKRVQAKLALCDKLEAEITAAEQHAEHLSTAILQEVFGRQK